MSNPWDQPPLPSHAEMSFDKIFTAVGAFITAWEYVEFKLALVYATFCRAPPEDWSKVQEYGQGLIYSHRIQHFTETANRFFVTHPNQALEGDLASIRMWCDGFATVRNDIVHGIVFDCSTAPELRRALKLPDNSAPQYLIIPPMHTVRKYAASVGMGAPRYAYNAAMIVDRFHHVHALQLRIDDFADRLSVFAEALPRRQSPSGSPPLPKSNSAPQASE